MPSLDEDDVVGWSGWLYSDLLLGLFLVFLAAVSFRIVLPAAAETDPQDQVEEVPEPCAYAIDRESLLIELPLSLEGQELADEAERRLAVVLSERPDLGPPEDVTFGFVLAFGRAPSTNTGVARQRAQTMLDRLVTALPERMAPSAGRPYWGGAGNEGIVEVEFFPLVGVPCAPDEDA